MAANTAPSSTISGPILDKAIAELKEKPEWRDRDIQAIRDMLLCNKALTCPLDSAFILRFLRARKFDYDRAYQLIINYYTIRAQNQDVIKTLTPVALKHVMDNNVTMILPNRDPHGRRILYFRPAKWDPAKFPVYDILRMNILNMEMAIEEEETQVSGIVVVGNMIDMSMNHVKNLERNYMKIMSSLMQDAFPMRMKGLHIVNEPSIFSYAFALIKPFMKEKLASRLAFHGSEMSELHKAIGRENLPEELEGSLPHGDMLGEEWKKKLFDASGKFEEMAKYKIELERDISNQKLAKDEAVECLVGTYRKLNVD